MIEYRTSDGDTVDYIAWKHYGSTSGRAVEQMLQANPGIADIGPVLPAGIIIVLPAIDNPATDQSVRLWD